MDRSARFTTTKWSVILRAGDRGDAGSHEALASLCEAYWYPLYYFVRRQGFAPDEALDLTQGFFAELLEKEILVAARPDRGRFRSFLLAAFLRHIGHERRKEHALKRGGGRTTVSLDAEDAEGRFRLEPIEDETPERAFERRWALAVIGRAQERLKSALEADGRQEQYRRLFPFLTDVHSGQTYQEAAAALETTEAAIKMAVLRLRRRLGRLLREEIADTVEEPEMVDAELKHLLAVLSGG